MSRLSALTVSFCVLMTAASLSAADDHKPSKCAEGMPGARGTIVFTPPGHMPGTTTWWKDTDGIAPGIAGCHFETDEDGNPKERFFGEVCLEDGDKLLVESHPNAYVLHAHKDDLGHPDTFDCHAWCQGSGHPEGGKCVPVTGAEVPKPCTASARCACG